MVKIRLGCFLNGSKLKQAIYQEQVLLSITSQQMHHFKCHLVMKRKARLSNLSIKTEQSPNYTHKLYSTGIKIIHSKWPGNDALFLRKNTMRQRLVAVEVDSERDFPKFTICNNFLQARWPASCPISEN